MKVYGIPEELPAPEPDYSNFNLENENQKIEDHMKRLKELMVSYGYSGKLTGEVVRFPVADGFAKYMVVHSSNGKMALVHLPYWDGYALPYIKRLTKQDIADALNRAAGIKKLFGSSN